MYLHCSLLVFDNHTWIQKILSTLLALCSTVSALINQFILWVLKSSLRLVFIYHFSLSLHVFYPIAPQHPAKHFAISLSSTIDCIKHWGSLCYFTYRFQKSRCKALCSDSACLYLGSAWLNLSHCLPRQWASRWSLCGAQTSWTVRQFTAQEVM